MTYSLRTTGRTVSPSTSCRPARRSTACCSPTRSTRTSSISTSCSRRGPRGSAEAADEATRRPATPTSRPSTSRVWIGTAPGPTSRVSRSEMTRIPPSAACSICTRAGSSALPLAPSRGSSCPSLVGARPHARPLTEPSGRRAVPSCRPARHPRARSSRLLRSVPGAGHTLDGHGGASSRGSRAGSRCQEGGHGVLSEGPARAWDVRGRWSAGGGRQRVRRLASPAPPRWCQPRRTRARARASGQVVYRSDGASGVSIPSPRK